MAETVHTSPEDSYAAHRSAEVEVISQKQQAGYAERGFTTAAAELRNHKATTEPGGSQVDQETARLTQGVETDADKASSAHRRANGARDAAGMLVKQAAEVYAVGTPERDAMQDEALALSQTPPKYVGGHNIGGSPEPIVRPMGPTPEAK